MTAHRVIVVEGPIGVGKTTLAQRLAMQFGFESLLECPEDNPFLSRFYQDPRAAALSAQLYFLFQRARQFHGLRQRDLFAAGVVADFMPDKDRLFAELNLDADELALYRQVYAQVTFDAPAADLVIYLQAPVPQLLDRIARRGLVHEQSITAEYLAALSDRYARYFLNYHASALLIVNTHGFDPGHDDTHFQRLLAQVAAVRSSMHYFNPVSDEVF